MFNVECLVFNGFKLMADGFSAPSANTQRSLREILLMAAGLQLTMNNKQWRRGSSGAWKLGAEGPATNSQKQTAVKLRTKNFQNLAPSAQYPVPSTQHPHGINDNWGNRDNLTIYKTL